MTSFYEFYKKITTERKLQEQVPAPGQTAAPQVPAPGQQAQIQPPQAPGQGVAPAANDKALEEFKTKLWPTIQRLAPQIQDPSLKKSLTDLAQNAALVQQGQQAAAKPTPAKPTPAPQQAPQASHVQQAPQSQQPQQ